MSPIAARHFRGQTVCQAARGLARAGQPCSHARDGSVRSVSFVWAGGAYLLWCAALNHSCPKAAGEPMTVNSATAPGHSHPIAGAGWRAPIIVVAVGCVSTIVAFGPRSALGFFLTPLSSANHWGRDVFAFALAIQNLLWGIGQPLAGMIADRFGTVKVVGRCVALRHGSRTHGAFHQCAHARSVGRCADRLRPVRLLVPGRAGGVWQTGAAGMANVRVRPRHCGWLIRPVPVFAALVRSHSTCLAGKRHS